MSIKLSNIYHTYSKGTPFERLALNDVSLEISKGEIVAIIGHTGSGKSTLVQHLNGLLKPDKGSASIDDIDITAKGAEAKTARQQVGMVFQYPEHQLFAETVFEDIAFGPRNKGFAEDEVEKQVREAMAFVGLNYDTYAQRSPFQLSGGQMRRAAIAGVVALQPKYLVLDEPTAGLDPAGRESILKNIRDYQAAQQAAVVMVSHSMEEIASNVDRLIVMEKGTAVMTGAPSEVFSHAAELVSMGLNVPCMTQVLLRLQQLGVNVPASAYTVEQAADLLEPLLKGGAQIC